MYNGRKHDQNRSNTGGSRPAKNRDFLTSRPSFGKPTHTDSSDRSASKSDDRRRSSPTAHSSGRKSFYSDRSDSPRRSQTTSQPSSSENRSFSGGERRNDGRSGGYRGGFGNKFGRRGSPTSHSGGGYRGGGGGRRFGRRIPGSASGGDHTKYIKKAIEKAEEVYTPKHEFNDFKIQADLKKNIAAKGYKIPTPIQDQSIPHLIEGKDVIGIANTGTGKTAAFLIPLINKIMQDPKQKVLIIVPTRELAQQIHEEFMGFSRGLRMFSVQCIGGASINNQIYGLQRQHNFVIGTPGRLKDLIDRRYLDLSKFHNIVLDEADRMVDMGFIDDIRFILAKLPSDRQSFFFSATMSREIDGLIRTFLKDPITVSVKTQPTSDNVEQDIVKVEPHEDKIEKLHDILIQEEVKKVLIFVRTKIGADRLDNELYDRGFKVEAIHGDKTQYKRQQALFKFKSNKVNILVATDVAARGLDIPNVSHVINYDEPENFDDYVHRIGRTGRANSKGKALTFVK